MARPPSANSLLKRFKQEKKQFQPKTPIATNIFLPNHSGDHSKGQILNEPVKDTDLVNKSYVDNNVFSKSHNDLTDISSDQHHAEQHTIASHSDTSATGSELNSLTDNSIVDTLHRHTELVATDGNPDPALSVSSLGYVGIGTSSPQSALHVKSQAKIEVGDVSNRDSYQNLWLAGSQAGIKVEIQRGYGGTALSLYKLFAHKSSATGDAVWLDFGVLGSMGTNGVAEDPVVSYFFMGCASNVSYSNNTFRLYPDHKAYFRGDVGIGTTSPSANLHIVDSTDPELQIQDTTNYATFKIKVQNNGATMGVSTSTHYLYIMANGRNQILLNQTYIRINPNQDDLNFFISGDNTTYLFFVDAGTDKIGVNTSSPDTQFQIVGDFKTGEDTTNYAKFDTDGNLTLYGTARNKKVDWIGANVIKGWFSDSATFVESGITGAWEFSDNASEKVMGTIKLPNDMDFSVAPSLFIGWSTDSANAGNCEWQLEYLYIGIDEDTTASAQETLTVTSAASSTSNGFVMVEFTGIDVPSSTDKAILWRLTRLGSDANDTISDTVELRGLAFQYTANKLGTPL